MLACCHRLEVKLSRNLATYALYLSPSYRLLQFSAGAVCGIAVLRGRVRVPSAWTAL